MQARCHVEHGNRGAARATMYAVNHHFLSPGAHAVNEIERSLDHLFLERKGEGVIDQTQRQPVFAMRHQVFIIKLAAKKQPWVYLNHASTAFVSLSSLSSTPAISNCSTSNSPEINFGNNKSRVLRRLAFFFVRTSRTEKIDSRNFSKEEMISVDGQSILILCISSFVTDLKMAPFPIVSSSWNCSLSC